MPRPVVKAVSSVVDKWKRRAGSAGEEYRLGVRDTTADWAAATKAAEPAWKAGVQEAITRNAYGQGVDRAGTAKWKHNAETLGPDRFSSGVANAEAAFSQAIGPVLAAISSVDLPQRGPTGSEGNYARSSAIGKALRQLRMGGRR